MSLLRKQCYFRIDLFFLWKENVSKSKGRKRKGEVYLMQILKGCVKCHAEFWTDNYGEHRIDGQLCEKCLRKWHNYFNKNHERLQKEYPEHVNPTWLAFMHLELIVPVRVEFT